MRKSQKSNRVRLKNMLRKGERGGTEDKLRKRVMKQRRAASIQRGLPPHHKILAYLSRSIDLGLEDLWQISNYCISGLLSSLV